MIWKCIARKRTVPHTGNCYFLAGDDHQLNNSPSSFRFPRALNMLSGLVTSVRVCEVCQYHICASMQVCEVCEFRLVTSVHQINARSPFPPSTLTDIIVLRPRSKSRIYLKDHIVKMCKRKTKYINLLRVSSYWKLLKLIGWQNCCSKSCRVIVARYQWLNSDYSIQRIFPHCQDIGSNSNIFGSLLTACEFKKYWLLKLIGRQNVVSSESTISG